MAYNSKYTGAEVEDLLEKVDGLSVPTKTSELANDSGYITDAALAGYATTADVDNALEAKQDVLTAGDGIDITDNVISATGGSSGITSITASGTAPLTLNATTSGGATTIAGSVDLSGKQDKLAYYSEEGTTVSVTMSDGENNKVAIDTGNDGNMSVTVGQDCEVTVGQQLKITSEDVDVYSWFTVFSSDGTSDILSVGGSKAYYNSKEIATRDDVATPADSVNATKNAVLALTSDDLLAERDKWFDEGIGVLPTLFEVMDYSATTNSVRLRCYVDTDYSMIELDCNERAVAYYPPLIGGGSTGSYTYQYAFDILVPYIGGTFTKLPHKYTIDEP